MSISVTRQRLHFITGRLAEFSLREALAPLGARLGFDYSVEVLGITVAALMTTDWVARRIRPSPGVDRIILPGYCRGDLEPVAAAAHAPVERGPKDLRRLAEYLGGGATQPEGYGEHDIQILAEINHAPRLPLADIIATAAKLRADGADLIDVGCEPGDAWSGVGEAVRALKDQGHRISIDSMNPIEIAAATRAGAELVLSVNSANRQAAADWGCEVVAVPDLPATLAELDETIEFLATRSVRLRIDPILEPIGFGFAASLGRYLDTRRRYPDAEILMGIGNLTELTDVDSAGVNVLLLGFCQEQAIHSVLTTQVINWARTSVKECDLARRLVYHAVRRRTLPKRLEPGLVMLRDPSPLEMSDAALDQLAGEIRDHNYRIFAAGGRLHALSAGQHWTGDDPFVLFDQIAASAPRPLDAGHAYYLGYEMAKAWTALTLGKEYRQDEALDWGFLTRPEGRHALQRTPLEPATVEPSGHQRAGHQPSAAELGSGAGPRRRRPSEGP